MNAPYIPYKSPVYGITSENRDMWEDINLVKLT